VVGKNTPADYARLDANTGQALVSHCGRARFVLFREEKESDRQEAQNSHDPERIDIGKHGRLALHRRIDLTVSMAGMGLVPPDTILTYDHLRTIGNIPVEADNAAFSVPLLRDASLLNQRAGPGCRYVLLGSIATEKYTRHLLEVFGERLLFPAEFVGRGDMSRGGLMLRYARTSQELSYVAVQGATLRGHRPPKLKPLR
jgi:hypothetical protein